MAFRPEIGPNLKQFLKSITKYAINFVSHFMIIMGINKKQINLEKAA